MAFMRSKESEKNIQKRAEPVFAGAARFW